MSITGIVSGIWIAMTGADDGNTAGTVLNTAQLIYAIEQKTEAGTWGTSAHEESHQMIKDTLRRIQNEQ
jgi:hypothetical protein